MLNEKVTKQIVWDYFNRINFSSSSCKWSRSKRQNKSSEFFWLKYQNCWILTLLKWLYFVSAPQTNLKGLKLWPILTVWLQQALLFSSKKSFKWLNTTILCEHYVQYSECWDCSVSGLYMPWVQLTLGYVMARYSV